MNLLRYVGIRSRLLLFCLLANGAGMLSLLAFVRSNELERVYVYIAANVVVVGVLAFVVAGSVTNPLMNLRRRLLEASPKEGAAALGEARGHDEITGLWEALLRWAEGLEAAEEDGEEEDAFPVGRDLELRDRSGESLSALLDLSKLGHESFDFAHAATAILERTNEHLGLEWSSVCLVDSDGGALHLVASVGLDRELSDDLRVEGGRPVQYEPGRGVSGEVIAKGEPLIINRGHRDKRFARFKDFDDHQQRINSIACFPLKVPVADDGGEGRGLEVVGVLNAFNIKSPPVFRPGDVAFLEAVAEILSVLLGRSGDFENAFLEEISGLYQSGYWLHQFREEAERFRRKPFSLGLIKMALRFSDGLEPARRNAILRETGAEVRRNFRKVDFACRDGIAFLIALPETDKLGTMFMAGRLKDRCDAIALDAETDETHFATDMGVAVCPGGVKSPDELLVAVDKALEQARMAGDHRLVCYGPPGEKGPPPKEEP